MSDHRTKRGAGFGQTLQRNAKACQPTFKRVRDFAQIKYDGVISEEAAVYALDLLEVDQFGLDSLDRKILSTLIEKFQGGPAGLDTLAAAIGEDAGTHPGRCL